MSLSMTFCRRYVVQLAGLLLLPAAFAAHARAELRRVSVYSLITPVFSADQIDTPLLILHGDLDHVPIGQADELCRLGKRARYVRYWGETHVIQSPENLRDMWARIFEWLEENLR